MMTLAEFFKTHPDVAIALSGGVDSAYLLYAAKRHAHRVKAYFVKSAFQPQFELEDARRLAQALSAELVIIDVDVLADERVRANASLVMAWPVGIRVARQAYEGFDQVKSPASRESLRISCLVSPHIRSGESTESSRRATIPGRSEASSLALVPSSKNSNPSLIAWSRMAANIRRLQ